MNEIMNVDGVEGYEIDGVAYLKLEDISRGLGFTQLKDNVEYVRWDRVEGYLEELGFPHKWGKNDFIPENVFYRLAMKAKNDKAERFQAKIADEVIPEIRKNGGYVANDELFINTYLPFADDNTKALFRLQLQANRESNAIIKQQQKQLNEQKPMVAFAETVTKSCDSILMRDMAKLMCKEGLNIGEKRLYKLLRERNVLMHDNKPYQSYVDRGFFYVKEGAYKTPYGKVKLNTTTMVTPIGQVWLVNKVSEWLGVAKQNEGEHYN